MTVKTKTHGYRAYDMIDDIIYPLLCIRTETNIKPDFPAIHIRTFSYREI